MTPADPDHRTVSPTSHGDDEALDQPTDRAGSEDKLVESDLLVEDVSIDGMCGVY